MSLGMISWKLIGARRVESKLKRLPKKVGKKVITKSLRKGAAIIRKRTQSLAPRKTGTMRKSIITRVASSRRNFPGVKALLQLFNTRKYPELISQTVSTQGIKSRRGFYPAAVEYGRAAWGRAGGAKVTKPQSFVRAGFHSSKKQAEAAIIRELKAGIKKVWRER